MKRLNLLLAVLFVFASVPLFAQKGSDLNKPKASPKIENLEEKIKKFMEEGKKRALRAKELGLKAQGVCVKCNQMIYSDGMHPIECAEGGVCMTEEDVRREQNANVPDPTPSFCSTCGEALSIDERFHGLPHVCKKEAQSKNICIYCGHEIVTDGMHPSFCSKRKGGVCTTGKDEEDLVPAGPVHPETRPTVCPKCHKGYPIDELYHGDTHVCDTAEEACIHCGKKVGNNPQTCEAQGNAPCTTSCPDCSKNLRDNSVCPDGTHHCHMGKTGIKPVKASKSSKSDFASAETPRRYHPAEK